MVSPYPQYPQSAPYGLGPLASPPPPGAVQRAMRLIIAGAVLSIVYGVVDGLTAHNSMFYSTTSTPSGTTVHQANYLVSGILGGVIQCLLWLWMAWKTKAGRNWARVLSTVFFGVMCLDLLVAIAVAALHSNAVLVLIITLIEWGVGLVALIMLWRPESGQFFAAARQAKLAPAFSPPYPGASYPGSPAPGSPAPGYPPSGFAPSPQQGQPPADSGPQPPPQ